MRIILSTLLGVCAAAGAYAQPAPLTLYVANQGADTISVVDGRTFEKRLDIKTGRNPHEILVDAARKRAYVSNRQEDTVSVIDLATHAELSRMGAPGAPHGLALASDGRTLFVTGRQEVHVLDLEGGKLTTTIPVGLAPHMLHATPDRSRVYTGNMRDGTVSAIDVATRKVIATIPVGRTPEDLAISPDGREMLVGNQDDDSVTVVDLTTHAVVDTVKLPERGAPIRLRYSLDGATVFIASRRDGAGVLRMDRKTRQVTGKIPLDGLCVGMNFTPDGKVLYITDLRAGTIAEVDPVSLKVQRTLATGAGADCIEVVAGAAGSQ